MVLWFRLPGSRLPARRALTWRRSLTTCKDRNHSREGFTAEEIRFSGQEELRGSVGEGQEPQQERNNVFITVDFCD